MSLASATFAPGIATSGAIESSSNEGEWVHTQDPTPVSQLQTPPLPDGNPFDFVEDVDGQLLPVDFLQLPDVKGLVPDASVVPATLDQMLARVNGLQGELGQLLGGLALPTDNALATLQQVLAAIDGLNLLTTSMPNLTFVEPLPVELPTTYTLKLTANGSTQTVQGQVCAPTPASWPGSVLPDTTVIFCPTPPSTVYLDVQRALPGTAPAGSMEISYDIPAIPAVYPSGGSLRLLLDSGGRPFPTTVDLETEVTEASGTNGDEQHIALMATSHANDLLAQVGAPPTPAPLERIELGLVGYGLLQVNRFPGGSGALNFHYADAGTFAVELAQELQGEGESIHVSRDAGAVPAATATFDGVPKTFTYTAEARYQDLAAGRVANGLRVKGELDQPGMGLTLREYGPGGALRTEFRQTAMPATFDKNLTVQLDPTGQYPLEVHTDQQNVNAPGGEQLAIGVYENGRLDSSIEIGGASQATVFDLRIAYDAAFRPTGFTVAGDNRPGTGGFVFSAAEYGGDGEAQKRFLVRESGGWPAVYGPGPGSQLDFALEGIDPVFSLQIQPSARSTSSGATTGFNLHATMGSDRPDAVATMSAVDPLLGRLGFLVRQLPTELNLNINVATGGTGVYIEETNSTYLSGALRQFFNGDRNAPTATMTVRGPTTDMSGAVAGGSALNLTRTAPPQQYAFDLAAPMGVCNAPSQVQFHANNFNLAGPTPTDRLDIEQPGVGSLSYVNIPTSESTRTSYFTLDSATCQPREIRLDGVTMAAQPDEAIYFTTPYGKAIFARFSAAFTTDIQVVADGSTQRLHIARENSAPNPEQFIQFGRYGQQGVLEDVITLARGWAPPGAMPTTGSVTTVYAHALSPHMTVLELEASAGGGTSKITGENTAPEYGAYVYAARAGEGAVKVENLAEIFEVSASVNGEPGSAHQEATVAGYTSTNYPFMVVTVVGAVAGRSGAILVSGPGVSNPPAPPPSTVEATWVNAPRSSFALTLGYDPTANEFRVQQDSRNDEPGSLLRIKARGIASCLSACEVAMGGGVRTGTSAITVSANPVSGHLELSGAYPTVPSSEYAQVWTSRNGAVVDLVSMLGSNAWPLLCAGCSSRANILYRGISMAFAFDAQFAAKQGGAQELHVVGQRSESCVLGYCYLRMSVSSDGSGAPTGDVEFTYMPTYFELHGRLSKQGVGNISYSAAEPGMDVYLANAQLMLSMLRLPTKATAAASGSFETIDFKAEITSEGSFCRDNANDCLLKFVDLIVRDQLLSFDERTFNIGPTPVGPNNWGTLEGTATVNLHYLFGSWLSLRDFRQFSFKLGAAEPDLPLPQIVIESTPHTPTSYSDMWIFGTEPWNSPLLCPPPCGPSLPDYIVYEGAVTAPAVGVVATMNDPPILYTQPTTGVFAFWGWDAFAWYGSKYQIGNSWGGVNPRAVAINTNQWDWWTNGDVPFAPFYSVDVNHLMGQNDYIHTKVYVLNPQNRMARAWDSSSSCPHYRVSFVWTTNCYWQVMLDLLPTHPTASA